MDAPKAIVQTEERQIYSDYDEAFQFLQKRKKRQVNQLVLLNNLQRGDENIASTLLLTLLNRTVASLYDDKMQVKFVPGEEMDQRKVNSLNVLAQSDYRDMDMQKHDYDWCWDTLFFGRGYLETLNFDKKRKLLKPHVINPLVFGYDPYFETPKEWRYYWKWITKSKWEIDRLIAIGEIKGISSSRDIPSGIDPYLWDYKSIRDKAKEGVTPPIEPRDGDVYQILEYAGHDKDGNKCIFWTDKMFNKILRKEKLDLKDGEYKGDSKWPIVVKEAFREPHSSIVFSVADLLEDKHRARSVLLNLAFIAAKDKANPLYWYDPDKVQDVTQLFSRQINQHIPVNGPGDQAIGPLNTENPMDPGLMAFMQTILQEANDPVGSGMASNPTKKGNETATEAAIIQQLNDLAQSLQSKVMQFGAKDFWTDWFNRYKRFTKEGDEKIATIVGVKGMTFEKIQMGDIHTSLAPGVLVFSAKEAEYKELVLRRDMMELLPTLATSMSPDGLRNFYKYSFMPKFLDDPQMMDLLFPPTIDEIKAEEENEVISVEKLPEVKETDNHEQHLGVHYQAKNTWAKWTHIAWHEELLAKEKQQQKIEAAMNQMPMNPAQPQVGAQKQNPMQSAAPLAQEMNQQNATNVNKLG